MKYQRKIKIYSWAGSLALHISVGLVIAANINFLAKTIFLGEKRPQIIRSYLYNEKLKPEKIVNTRARMPHAQNDIKTADKPVIKEKSDYRNSMANAKPKNNLIEKKASAQISVNASGQSMNQLIVLLHQAIQVQQKYPASALAMQREGRATVGFILAPDGSIAYLHLIKTSGTASLDAAALDAVNKASPFQRVANYLTHTKEFQIDVVFELPVEIQ